MFTKIRHSRSGFTLIELLIGMTIFSIAMTSIYLLLTSTMKSVSYSRNEIIVSNLLREQMELFRNVRDSNIASASAWNAWRVESNSSNNSSNNFFSSGTYTLENDFSSTGTVFDDSGKITQSPVKIFEKSFSQEDLNTKFDATQLCFDEKNRYVHCENDIHKTNSGTIFASYAHIFPMNYEQGGSPIFIEKDSESQWFIIDARVIVRDGNNYREYDAKTGLTDWHQ